MWIVLIGIVVLSVGVIIIYNKLIQGRIHVKEGFSGIDVQLKRRHDLIPNLVEAVKGYMQHEKSVLENVIKLRSQVAGATGIKERIALENNITQALKTLFAVAEAYPDLKADKGFLDLHKNLSSLEDEIQLARRYYNGTVRNYNISVESFPSNLIASLFKFQKSEFFEIESVTERATPEVKI